jgi:hypothetical protein
MGSGLLRFRVALTSRAAPAAAGDARADRDGRVPDGSSILREMGRRIQPWHRLPLAWLVLATLVGRYRVTLDHDLGIAASHPRTRSISGRVGPPSSTSTSTPGFDDRPSGVVAD